MTLKRRIALIVALLMLAFVAAHAVLLYLKLHGRAFAETGSAVQSMAALLPAAPNSADPDSTAALARLTSLVRGLGPVRHAQVNLYSSDGTLLASTPTRQRAAPGILRGADRGVVPVRKEVIREGQLLAYFEVSPAADDELAELWDEFIETVAVVGLLSLPVVGLITWLSFRALAPLDDIRDGLRAVAAGHTERRLQPTNYPDIDEIVAAFNRMAQALGEANDRSHMLMRKLLESDEQTRRSVAHDLHDDLSPFLVALQPLVRSLQLRCAERPDLEDTAATFDTVIEHQSRILVVLRRILAGLHPPELETFGLRRALEQLARPGQSTESDRMQVRFEATQAWESFGPTVDANVYRMVQECLTNARRHSNARLCTVTISIAAASEDGGMMQLVVENDGVGRTPVAVRAGWGALGLRDRCIALGGACEFGPAHENRWRVSIEIPLKVHGGAFRGQHENASHPHLAR